MAKISGFGWARPLAGQDFHVLSGQTSGALGLLLAIVDDTAAPGNSYFASRIPAGRGISVKFIVEPVGGSAPAGVAVFADGAIAIATTSTVSFFVVRVEASDSTGVFANKPRIRVQVHSGLATSGPKVWFTPQTLSIHRGSDGQVISVFAEFADGMVGDITELPDLMWALVNTSDSSKLTIDDWGALTGLTDLAVVSVKVTLPTSWGGLSATAKVEVLPPWGTATTLGPMEAHLVAGDRANKDTVPNLLFIPEGFTDRLQFIDTVQKIVHSLRTEERSSPYDWLRDDLNYWFAWIPSPSSEAGTSVVHEMVTFTRKDRLFGVQPPPDRPTPGSVLADERNSTLGLSVGGRLNLENQRSKVSISWYPRRTQRAHLDGFLAALKDPDATNAAAPKIGLTWTTGKDRAFVIALVAGAHYGGTRTPDPRELIAPALDGAEETELSPLSGRRMQHVPYPIPKNPAINGRMVLAHEVAHAFGLDDEYGETGRITPNRLPITALNIQDDASLQTGGLLDGAKLKWLWPRVKRAAELTGPPTGPDGSGQFTIPVKTKQELSFDAEHVFVQLRSRKLDPSNLRWSDVFRVVSKAAGQLVVKPDKTVPNSKGITTFVAGDLSIAPVRLSQNDLPLLLVHERIVAHITQFHQPLNAPKQPTPARKCGDQVTDDRAIQPATNFPAGLNMPNHHETWEAVGLFEGGDTFLCGVYHSSGACVMRQAIPNPLAPEDKQRVLRFCPVCRYIMVDKLAPVRHRLLDQWFDRRYPTT